MLCFLGVGLRNVSFMSIVMIQKHVKFTQQECVFIMFVEIVKPG